MENRKVLRCATSVNYASRALTRLAERARLELDTNTKFDK